MDHDRPRRGLDGIEEDLSRQRGAVSGRSPPYERALALLPEVLSGPAGRFVAAAWEKRTFFAWYDRPLLLLAAIRNDALAEGSSHPLHEAFVAPAPRVEAVTADALAEALEGWRDRVWDALARRGVQTNETARGIAWLWPAHLAGASGGARPLALVDVGASAGLNLVADDLPNVWVDEDGAPMDVATSVRAVSRVGFDVEPLDATKEDDARWLRACIWPGEPHRLARLEAGLTAFRAARTRPDAPVLVPILARDVPAKLDLLSVAEPSVLVIAYQTVMSAYLEPVDRSEYEAGMRNWLRTHPPGRGLWIELEAAANAAPSSELPAALCAHVRAPSGEVETLELARCHYHPRRIERRLAAAARLAALLRTPGAASAVAARP